MEGVFCCRTTRPEADIDRSVHRLGPLGPSTTERFAEILRVLSHFSPGVALHGRPRLDSMTSPRLTLWVALLTVVLAPPVVAQAPNQWNTISASSNSFILSSDLGTDGTLYIGGQFSTVNGVTVNRLAQWDPVNQTWQAVGAGIGIVRKVVSSPDGSVYAIGPLALSRWVPSAAGGGAGTLTAIPAANGQFETGTVAADGRLYVGGGFSGVGGQGARNIAVWSNAGGGSWSQVGGGAPTLNSRIRAAHAASDGAVYFGGSFPTVRQPAAVGGADLTVNNVARWDPAANSGAGGWTDLGGGVSGGTGLNGTQVISITEGADGVIYVAGDFTMAGTTPVSNIAAWDPAGGGGNGAWSALGSGLNGEVRELKTGPDGIVAVLGNFTLAGSLPVTGFARWDPSGAGSWSTLPGVNPSTVSIAPTGSIYAASLSGARGVFRWDFPSAQTGVSDMAGWRLLSAPGAGLTVDDLAGLNLVQGIAAGTPATTFPAQYAGASPNLYTGYRGSGATDYVAPSGTDDVLEPGRGFFWYFFDQSFGPLAGGTSASVDLAGFVLDRNATATPGTRRVPFSDNNDGLADDNFHMLGNPFDAPFSVDGISVRGGTLQGGVVSAYDPVNGYQVLFAENPSNNNQPDVAGVWQGFFGEITPSIPGNTSSVTYDIAAVDANGSPPFVGRRASRPYLRVRLSGTASGNVPLADGAAYIRFIPEAETGWDALDASKLTPPGGPYALVAPVIERDGALYRLSLDSRPLAETTSVPLAFTSTDAASVSLEWDGADTLPDGWVATLTDRATGTIVDLRTEAAYTFVTEAAGWSERFLLTFASATSADGGAEAGGPWLSAPHPNPTSTRTALTLHTTGGRAEAHLYDALGRRVATLLDRDAAPGSVVPLTVETAGLAPGVYVVRATSGAAVLSRPLTVVR